MEELRGGRERGKTRPPGSTSWLAAFTVLCVTSARYLIEPLEGSGRNAVVMREVVSTAWQSSEFNDVFKWT